MKRLDEITIADLMPDSISKDAEVSATSRAIDPQLKAVSEAVDKPLILAAIDDLSEGVLEHLAVQYDVTAWNSAWPIETKRAVLKTAIADKRKMGTRGAVQRAIEAVAPIATITEWWQDTGGDMPPHTFKIDLLQQGSAVDAETQESVISQVNEAKPVRSHFTFTVEQTAESGFYFAGVIRSIAYARVRSAGITIEQMGIQTGVLAAMRGMAIRRFLAETEMGELPWPQFDFVFVNGAGHVTSGVMIRGIEFTGQTGQFTIDDADEIIWAENSPPPPPPPSEFTAYFSAEGSSRTIDYYIDFPTVYDLHDSSGTLISLDTSKTYTITKLLRYSGEELDVNLVIMPFKPARQWLNLRKRGGGGLYVYCLKYTVS